MPDDGVEQGSQTVRLFRRLRCPALFCRSIEDREVELFVSGAQGGEKIEDLFMHFVRAAIRLVDLVDHNNRLQAKRQSLHGDKLGLRHGPFRGIDQQGNAIDHAENTLHLAAEVGMARGVDDIDAGAFPVDRGTFRKDGNPAFPFQVIGIHGALGDLLVLPERTGLFKQLVDQSGLAMIDVRDNRNIAEAHNESVSNALFRAVMGVPYRRPQCQISVFNAREGRAP